MTHLIRSSRSFGLNRRTFLRGLGGAAIALPWLEAMTARAAEPELPKRLLVWYTAGGTVREDWAPSGGENDFVLGSILAPLERHRDQLLIVDGLELAVTAEGNGHPHTRGMGALLTGLPTPDGEFNTCGGTAGFIEGASLDQVIGGHVGADTKFGTFECGLQWPTTGTGATPMNVMNFAGPGQPVPPVADPQQAFELLFAGFDPDAASGAILKAQDRSVLDAVAEEYRALGPRLGASDRAKLDAHLEKIKELEAAIGATGIQGQDCALPSIKGGLDPRSNDDYPALGTQMMDLLAMAFACDLTRVATLMWGDSPGRNRFPFLDLPNNHHDYQHDQGFNAAAIRTINTYYNEQLASFLDRLADMQEGDGTVLDNTVVLCVTEIAHPANHSQVNMPFVLAGSAGGHFNTGRYLQFDNEPHNNLLVSLQQAFGIDSDTFGDDRFVTGPLTGLT